MKTALVGLGVIGRVHFKVLTELGISVDAVCDVEEKKFEKFPDIPSYKDYVTMLNEVKPDVVHICTPHYLHADMIIEALSHDINVLCEKPLCIKEEDIPRILDAEKSSKAILGVCHQNRYNKENAFLKEYLKDKTVLSGYGNTVWGRDIAYYLKDEWRGKWATEGGGVLINQALHTLDLLIWLVGMPKKVTARIDNFTLKNKIEVEDTASIICSDGAEFSFFATNGSKISFPVSVVIKTEEQTVCAFPDRVITNSQVFNFEKQDEVYGKSCYGRGHKGLINDFYDCVNTHRKFEVDGAEASKVVKVILAAYKSNGENVVLS